MTAAPAAIDDTPASWRLLHDVVRDQNDPILAFLAHGGLKDDLTPLKPSGVDLAVAALTREMLNRGHSQRIAFALPRGQHPLPLFLGLYLALGRLCLDGRRSFLPLLGSVGVFSTDPRLRELAPRLRAAGASTRFVEAIDIRRLRGDGHYGTLNHRKEHGQLDHTQHFVLLALPYVKPDLAPASMRAAVMDAAIASRDTWEASFGWHTEQERRQIWFGELGDRDFEDFCERHHIPLLRFDWPTIRFCAHTFGVGSGPLSTAELCARSLIADGTPLSIELRPVVDGALNHELYRLERCFADWHRRAEKLLAKGVEEPAVVTMARRLTYLLARLACPLRIYDTIALDTPRVMHVPTALRRIRDATDKQFFGPWRKLNGDWAAIRGGLTALYECVREDEPKWFDLVFLLDAEAAREPRRRVVIRCATKVEAHALSAALLAEGAVDADAFDSGWLSVHYFGVRDRALEHGPADADLLTVITEPPPPARSGPYLGGESGQLQALLYPCQTDRFERLAARAASRCDGSQANPAALCTIGLHLYGGDTYGPQPPPQLVRLQPLVSGRRAVDPAETVFGDSVERMRDYWEEFLEPTDINTADADRDSDDGEGGGLQATASGSSHQQALTVWLSDGKGVLLPAAGNVDTLVGEQIITRPVRSLPVGARVVLMEGSERGSATSELFDAWDSNYGPAQVYGPLYRQAVQAAIDNAGSCAQLATKLEVSEQTVRNWRDGDVIGPDSGTHLAAVLATSGIQPAIANQARIQRYITRTRGAHSTLGKAFSRAVVNHFVDPDNATRAKLEADTGRDLSELFDSVRLRVVDGVEPQPRSVPAGILGRPLPPTHHALTGRTV
jgi:hypothetical protein